MKNAEKSLEHWIRILPRQPCHWHSCAIIAQLCLQSLNMLIYLGRHSLGKVFYFFLTKDFDHEFSYIQKGEDAKMVWDEYCYLLVLGDGVETLEMSAGDGDFWSFGRGIFSISSCISFNSSYLFQSL